MVRYCISNGKSSNYKTKQRERKKSFFLFNKTIILYTYILGLERFQNTQWKLRNTHVLTIYNIYYIWMFGCVYNILYNITYNTIKKM